MLWSSLHGDATRQQGSRTIAAPVRYMTVVSCLLNAASPFSTAVGMFALALELSELKASSKPKRSFAWKYRRLHALFAML